MLRTDLENGLHKCVNFKINTGFIKIFTNKLNTKSKQVYFNVLAPPKYNATHEVKYNNIFIESEAESIRIIHNTIKQFVTIYKFSNILNNNIYVKLLTVNVVIHSNLTLLSHTVDKSVTHY